MRYEKRVIAEKIFTIYNENNMQPKIFLRTHRKKVIVGAPIIFLFLIGSSGVLSSVNTLSFSATDSIFAIVGDSVPVAVNLSTRTPINAAGGTVLFSEENLSALSLTRTSSIIDLWSEEPVISNQEGSIRFSGGIIGPHVGANGNKGEIFTINFQALKAGKVTLRIKDAELLANDGSGANEISSTGSLTLYIRERGKSSPDINQDGEISITDVNALYLKTFRTYDAIYDLNGDEKINWSDVRLLISLL